jgi:hypothetical protein
MMLAWSTLEETTRKLRRKRNTRGKREPKRRKKTRAGSFEEQVFFEKLPTQEYEGPEIIILKIQNAVWKCQT